MTLLPNPSELSRAVLPFRLCVGIMLLNRDGLVWVGRRRPKWASDHMAHMADATGRDQKYEPPRIAALRELREETGISSVEVIDRIFRLADLRASREPARHCAQGPLSRPAAKVVRDALSRRRQRNRYRTEKRHEG